MKMSRKNHISDDFIDHISKKNNKKTRKCRFMTEIKSQFYLKKQQKNSPNKNYV